MIEIDEEPFTRNGNKLYRATNFASLVFDSYGLSLLEEYKEPEPELREGDLVEIDSGRRMIVVMYKYGDCFGGFDIQKDRKPCSLVGIEIKRIKKILKHYDCIETVLEDLKK